MGETLDQGIQAMELTALQKNTLSPNNILCLLQNCIQRGKDLMVGRKIHALLIINGLDSASVLGDYLIRFFTLCGSLMASNQVFVKLNHPSVYTWNAIISAHAKLGEEGSAIALFYKMQGEKENVRPNRVTFLTLLKACHSIGAIREGMVIHDHINRSEHGLDVSIGNTLVDMYAKCAYLDEAYTTFNNLPCKDLVSWSVMIAGYAQLGYGLSALELFERMQQLGMEPCKITYLSSLNACSNIQAALYVRQIQEHIIKSGLESDVVLGSSLVDVYCKCCNLEEARRVFDRLPKRNVVSWDAMITGYMQQGHNVTALELFTRMQKEGIDPDTRIFFSILKACGSIEALEQGRLIHEQINKSGLASDVTVGTALVDFYVKCRSLEEARSTFDQLPKQNVMLWAAMMEGYAAHGPSGSAFQLFENMLQEGISPNKSIFLSMLQACDSSEAIGQGRFIHDQIIRAELDTNSVVGTIIVGMYVNWGSLEEAHKVFDNLPNRDAVSWSAIISGYVQCGNVALAMELFEKMQQAGITPDKVTFLCMLKACSSIGAIAQGMLMHEKIIKSELVSDILVGNTIVDMYVKCGSLEDARKVLDDLRMRTVVSWSSLIIGYVQHGHGYMALELFERMQQESIKPNEVTLVYLLKACSSTGVVKIGRWIHSKILREGLTLDTVLGSVLVEMYARCGSLKEASRVFDKLPSQDAVSWGAMISGYAEHDDCMLAMKYFYDMQKQSLKPNDAIFASILSACSNAGLVVEGWHFFNDMKNHYGVTPSVEHYSCMVDLLGRAGYLDDAAHLLESMPVLPNIVVWTSLLTSCKTHGNLELGRHCFSKAVNLDPNDASAYLLVSSIFGDTQLWEHVCDVQESRKHVGAEKRPGRAWIETRNAVHVNL